MPISSIGDYYQFSTSDESSASGELDKDAFLNLMVTELKYQDPMNPMDNTEYVAQLAQFSSLEQLYNVNENLSDNAFLTQSMHNSIVSSMIGKEVKATSNIVPYDGSSEAEINYTLADEADVTVSIYTADGDLVKTIDAGHVNSGEQSVAWDGTNFMGSDMPEGTYYVDVVATDADGNEVAAIPLFSGVITGLKYNDGNPVFLVGDAELDVSDILEIHEYTGTDDE